MAIERSIPSLHNTFNNKKVLVTGNTGFKGSWLTIWLNKLGANVSGFSNNQITYPSMYKDLNVGKMVKQTYGDITDFNLLLKTVEKVKPDFIFHLAAQSIVSKSYTNALETIRTNSYGTATILEVMLKSNFQGVAVMVTSDKCYENDERNIGYVESDRLGGNDPYSASKASAEIILSSYIRSFFTDNSNNRIAIARAGNVIGGGDWNENRIIVDCIKAWLANKSVSVRNPTSTRPWQHVLEPLSGYLRLAQILPFEAGINGQAFNFGPKESSVHTVKEIVDRLGDYWGHKNINDHYSYSKEKPIHEASLLSLNCEKAAKDLLWVPKLDINECLKMVADWYLQYKSNPMKLIELTMEQITYYETKPHK
jgi:CDP-glucose 4,6-dehydratase